MRYFTRRYFSGFCTNQVEAENGEEALEMARQLPVNINEICETLESWESCDEVEQYEEQFNN